MNISPQLKSQYFQPRVIIDFLYSLDLINDNFRYQDLKFECWYNGLWTNLTGIISYWEYADYLRLIRINKGRNLYKQKLGDHLFLVQGKLKSRYAVMADLKVCECPLFKVSCRLKNELPQLFKHLPPEYYCHHLAAIKD